MKLSQVRRRYERDLDGQWFWWRDTIYIQVRGFSHIGYQRAIRAAQSAHPAPPAVTEDSSADEVREHQKATEEREHAIGLALLPAVARELWLNWWGVDAEVDPVELDVGESPVVRVVATVGKFVLETLEHEGRSYRREGNLWQEMVPYTPELGLATLQDPKCADLLNAVRAASGQVERTTLVEDALALGKLRTTSAGTSPMATTKSSSG